jgi:hypothetical protein
MNVYDKIFGTKDPNSKIIKRVDFQEKETKAAILYLLDNSMLDGEIELLSPPGTKYKIANEFEHVYRIHNLKNPNPKKVNIYYCDAIVPDHTENIISILNRLSVHNDKPRSESEIEYIQVTLREIFEDFALTYHLQ